LHYGRHSFLLTGDAEKQVENDLIGMPIHADVLKVGQQNLLHARFPRRRTPPIRHHFRWLRELFTATSAPLTLEHLDERQIELSGLMS
jgi:hypothetical protein